MKVHLISIGGSIMHNLAIALHKKGYLVTGSDDEIFEPAKSRLERYGLLPDKEGWFSEKIDSSIDIIIVGMHAREDNPELKKALELGLKIYSFPQFIYENNRDKERVVIAGSHGKTTITSMILHVLNKQGIDFDYLVGSSVKGLEDSVRLSETAKLIVLEGDEYLTSALDRVPKFLWYKPRIALISGIAWDHMNVFPTFEIYVRQFEDFISSLPDDAALIWDAGDKILEEIVARYNNITKLPYSYPDYEIKEEQFLVRMQNGTTIPLKVFGRHNLLNMEGASLVCEQLGVSREDFYKSISDFTGAGKRLELLYSSDDFKIFRDFAHSPSKVKATIEGIAEQFKGYRILACLELHTYSSMSKAFLPQYRDTMKRADVCYVFINPEEAKLKRLELSSEKEVKEAFNRMDMKVYNQVEELFSSLQSENYDHTILLMMSSGNFGGLDVNRILEFAK